jgi:hypothetical protein
MHIPSPLYSSYFFVNHDRIVELAGTGGIHLAVIPSLLAGLSVPYRPDCVDQQHF